MDDLQNLVNAIHKASSNREAAKWLGIAESTLRGRYKKAKELGIEPNIPPEIPSPPPKNVHSILWFTDAHNSPKLDKDRFHWLGRFIQASAPDIIVDGGDFDEMESLCRHVDNESWKGKFKPAFMEDCAASEEARSILAGYIDPKIEKHFLLGNHEDRLFSFENRNPEIYGMMQHEYLEVHKRHGWTVHPYRSYLTLGGVDFTHIPMNGMNQPAGGLRAAVNVATKSVRDVCFGHTHTFGYWEEPKYGPSRSCIAINGGCFMPEGYMPEYARGSQKRFWYGAHLITVIDGRIASHLPVTMAKLRETYS